MKTTKQATKSCAKNRSFKAPALINKELEYDRDFFKWTKTQANLLKKGHLEKLDIDHLIEEIESLGRNDKRAIRSYLTVLLLHLLKQKYQPEGQGNSDSWKSSILNATRQIKLLIADSPSLKNELKKVFSEAYKDAREDASIETKKDKKVFPEKCPWEIEEILPFFKSKNT